MGDNVRVRLGHPRAQSPSAHDILLNLSTQIQRYLNELALSGRTWAVDEVPLVVGAGQEDYPITATNFGRPLQVRTVYSANPSYIERDVEFDELADMNYNWPYPKNLGSLITNVDGSPNTAMRMAFYRRGGLDQAYVRVTPIPAATATYQILYQVGSFADSAALATVPVLPEHHALLEIRTAISLLPLAEWSDDAKVNASKQQALALSLSNDERFLASSFTSYIRSVGAKRRPTIRHTYSID
jgi:hypothetical protein